MRADYCQHCECIVIYETKKCPLCEAQIKIDELEAELEELKS